jgi:hypothetical protein
MHEDITLTTFGCDEAIPFFVAKPLYGTPNFVRHAAKLLKN